MYYEFGDKKCSRMCLFLYIEDFLCVQLDKEHFFYFKIME